MASDAPIPWAAWTPTPAAAVTLAGAGAEPVAPLDWWRLVGGRTATGAQAATAAGSPPPARPTGAPRPGPARPATAASARGAAPIAHDGPPTGGIGLHTDDLAAAARDLATLARAAADAQRAVAEAHAAYLRIAATAPWGPAIR